MLLEENAPIIELQFMNKEVTAYEKRRSYFFVFLGIISYVRLI